MCYSVGSVIRQCSSSLTSQVFSRNVLLILENGLSPRIRRTIAELYNLFNYLERRIHFLIRKLKQYSVNQKPVTVSPKLKVLVLKRSRRLLLLMAKEPNLRMAVTLLHGLVWFHGCTQMTTGRCWWIWRKKRQESADIFYSWCPRSRKNCHE